MTFATAFWLLFSRWWTIDPGSLVRTVSLSGDLEQILVPVWEPLLWNVVVLAGIMLAQTARAGKVVAVDLAMATDRSSLTA